MYKFGSGAEEALEQSISDVELLRTDLDHIHGYVTELIEMITSPAEATILDASIVMDKLTRIQRDANWKRLEK